jgi:hypothetical protein
MIARLFIAGFLILPCACAAPTERALPPCWVNKSYKDGERVSGRVTLLVSDEADWASDGPSIMVSPLTCENGSFRVLSPPPNLMKLRKAFHEKRPSFGSVYDADIRGTVRLIRPASHIKSEDDSPYSLEISEARNLVSIPQPRWWNSRAGASVPATDRSSIDAAESRLSASHPISDKPVLTDSFSSRPSPMELAAQRRHRSP